MPTPPAHTAPLRTPPLSLPIALWAAGGVVLILAQAILRLAPIAWEPVAEGQLVGWLWLPYLGSLVFNAYAEGYRSFQKVYAPRVVARALHLARFPRWHHVLLAPLFCMGFFHATRRRLIVSWVSAAVIVGVVVAVRAFPQPWRGIVDVGVVVGLSWGAASIVVSLITALRGRPPAVSPDLPETHAPVSPVAPPVPAKAA